MHPAVGRASSSRLTFCLWLSGCGVFATGISVECQGDLWSYLTCNAATTVFSLCSSKQLLNMSAVQHLLNCSDVPEETRIAACEKSCLETPFFHKHALKPCSPSMASMHGFSATLNILSISQMNATTNFSHNVLIPMPNIKNTGGLQMIDFGVPNKCAQITSAQYCVLTGGIQGFTINAGQCLPKACSSDDLEELKDAIMPKASGAAFKLHCGLVRAVPGAATDGGIAGALGWGGTPVEYPRTMEPTVGTWVMVGICILLALLVAFGSGFDVLRGQEERRLHESRQHEEGPAQQPQSPDMAVPLRPAAEPADLPPRGPVEGFLYHWSLKRNGASLLRTRPAEQNTFACLDALRCISMGQVILGHMYVYVVSSVGMQNMEQFNPPMGLLGRASFQFIPGCFYAVDSFFVMSGFLCAYGLQKKVFSRPGSTQPARFSLMYFKFILNRYLRLVPVEMFCIFLSMCVLPLLGTGILWNLARPSGDYCYSSAGTTGCDTEWWKNMLFINNFNTACYAHTWYLAVDMQLYLTAPLFALAYGVSRRAGWALLTAGLIFGIVFPPALALSNNYVPDILLAAAGGFDFMNLFYARPWSRSPAFLIGIATGWLWQERLEKQPKDFSVKSRLVGYALSCLALALCLGSTIFRTLFYQCGLADCTKTDTNPVPRPVQLLWGSLGIPVWCVGLSMVMVLTFQGRFIPLLQGFLNLDVWQPLAKLTYSGYLIHTSILILNYCQQSGPVEYSAALFFFRYVAFVLISLIAAFLLYMAVEKPFANLQMKLLGGAGD